MQDSLNYNKELDSFNLGLEKLGKELDKSIKFDKLSKTKLFKELILEDLLVVEGESLAKKLYDNSTLCSEDKEKILEELQAIKFLSCYIRRKTGKSALLQKSYDESIELKKIKFDQKN